MINNRQNGRRRGRGGPQVRNGAGGGGGGDRGNRIDNRARGNAVQLHEKYRNLARDAQTQGDRVMTEYYLQFADHYFRVLSETRARFEENQPRPRHDEYEDGGDETEGFDDRVGQDRIPQDRVPQPPRQERYAERPEYRQEQPAQRRAERDRPERDRPDRDRTDQDEAPRFAAPQAAAPAPASPSAGNDGAPQGDGAADEVQPPRRGRRPRRDGAAEATEQRVDADRLTPPAFLSEGATPAADVPPTDGAEPPRRRRTRRAKEDGDSVAA